MQQHSLQTQVAILLLTSFQPFLLLGPCPVDVSWEEVLLYVLDHVMKMVQGLGMWNPESDWKVLLRVGASSGRKRRGMAGRLALLMPFCPGCWASSGS